MSSSKMLNAAHNVSIQVFQIKVNLFSDVTFILLCQGFLVTSYCTFYVYFWINIYFSNVIFMKWSDT